MPLEPLEEEAVMGGSVGTSDGSSEVESTTQSVDTTALFRSAFKGSCAREHLGPSIAGVRSRNDADRSRTAIHRGVRLENLQDTSMDPSTLGRRARNRVARHDQLMAAASDIIDESGLDGLTMQAVADRVDCAVGTIYTYFASKAALVAALQGAAMQTVLATYHRAAEQWDDALDESGVDDPAVESLVRVLAYGRLFLSGPQVNPREFEFLQMALTSPVNLVDADDVAGLTTHALTLLAEGMVLVEAAVAAGAISAPDPGRGDDQLRRMVRWIGALEGALLLANVRVEAMASSEAAVFDATQIGMLVSQDLLLAWGAPPRVLKAAVDELDRIHRAGRFLPQPV